MIKQVTKLLTDGDTGGSKAGTNTSTVFTQSDAALI